MSTGEELKLFDITCPQVQAGPDLGAGGRASQLSQKWQCTQWNQSQIISKMKVHTLWNQANLVWLWCDNQKYWVTWLDTGGKYIINAM